MHDVKGRVWRVDKAYSEQESDKLARPINLRALLEGGGGGQK